MKEYYLNTHSDLCKNNINTCCSWNVVEFIMYHKNEYLFFKANNCLIISGSCVIDLKENIVEKLIKNYQKKDPWAVTRNQKIDEHFKDVIKLDKKLKKNIWQVHAISSNNFNTMKVITSKIDYIDAFFDNDEREKSYNSMKEFLIKKRNLNLIKELDLIYNFNNVDSCKEIDISNTIEELVKKINKIDK